jgi:hypothetical protein
MFQRRNDALTLWAPRLDFFTFYTRTVPLLEPNKCFLSLAVDERHVDVENAY